MRKKRIPFILGLLMLCMGLVFLGSGCVATLVTPQLQAQNLYDDFGMSMIEGDWQRVNDTFAPEGKIVGSDGISHSLSGFRDLWVGMDIEKFDFANVTAWQSGSITNASADVTIMAHDGTDYLQASGKAYAIIIRTPGGYVFSELRFDTSGGAPMAKGLASPGPMSDKGAGGIKPFLGIRSR